MNKGETMKKLLIVGIVLAVCFVGTAGDMNLDAVFTTEAVITTPEWNQSQLVTTELVFIIGPPECQHEKLKALGDNCWGMQAKDRGFTGNID